MKKITALVLAIVFQVLLLGSAHALTFSPTDPDMMDLDHYKAYAWVLRPIIPVGEVITSATLNIYGIYDWAAESGDRLYIGLIDADGMTKGTGGYGTTDYGITNNFFRQYTDNQAFGNYFGGFSGYQSIIPVTGYYTDQNGGLPKENLSYSISLAALGSVFNSTDAVFGIAFDPDCHYYNNKIELVLTSEKVPNRVPEPNMLLLFGSALTGLAFFARRIR